MSAVVVNHLRAQGEILVACLTSGYSKTLANDAAAVSPCTSPTTIAFGRMTLRGTPAEALGPTDHAWSIGELLNWPNPQIPLAETLGALGKVKREGLARHVTSPTSPSR